MKRLIKIKLFFSLVCVFFTVTANAQYGGQAFGDPFTITFEGTPSGLVFEGYYANYMGFNWHNLSSLNYEQPLYGGLQYAASSGVQAVYNFQDGVATIQQTESSNQLFAFYSASLISVWNEGLNVLVEGWLEENVVHSKTVTLTTSTSSFVEFDFSAIDKLTFTPSGGTHNENWDPSLYGTGTYFAMDDLTFANEIPPVPEPSSYAMMLVGLGMMGWAFRKDHFFS